MKLMKRATALLLCFLMLTNGPISAFATEGVSDNDVVVETNTTTETVEVCKECGGSDAHTETCSFSIVAPLTTETPDETTEPTTTPTETTENTEPTTTPTVATGPAISTDPVGCTECNQTEGHLESCSQYVAPTDETTAPTVSGNDIVGCTECGQTEGHTTECSRYVDPNACAECKQVDGHAETCSQYVAPVIKCEYCQVELLEGVVHLDTCLTLCTCEPVEGVHQEGCKFYIVPVDENACNCEYPPESGNIADHVDGCPRKVYIKSLFDGKDAEEIYKEWESYDVTTQTDLLNMLQRWDGNKYEELKKLVDGATDEDFPVVEVEGISIGVVAEDGVFPDGTSVQISNVEDANSQIAASKAILSECFSDCTVNILSSKVVDISFICSDEIVQPNGSVYVTFDIPAEELVPSANNLAILHIADNGSAELMAVRSLDNTDSVTVTVEATHFSHFVILQSQTTYNPTLMRTMLQENDRYSIVEFPVTLNDFDASVYNKTYDASGLQFTTGTAGTGMNLGALPATQGIVQRYLKNGYPVTNGSDRGSIIFSGDSATGKTPHSNVNFEFIYDNSTGYYTYNSGANHAQYNSDTNKVELYADTLAPYNYRTNLLLCMTTNPNRDYVQNMGTSSTDPTNIIVHVQKQTDNYMFEITDHYFSDVDTDEYTHMYLRLKATFGGDIKCKVFYSDGSDDTYTLSVQEDTWADYVFGPFDTGKTAQYVRFYVPGAEKGDSVEIDTAGVLQTDNSTEVNFAGFYPFNTTLTTSYAGSEKFNMNTWENLIQSGNNHQLYSSRVMYNKPYDNNTLNDPYAYFSMAMEVDFYIPANGKVNGQDIVFNFNGDDDMWVFVDGELALDIGGAHTDVEGSINFTTGATYVANVRSLTDSTTTGNGPKNGNLSSGQYATGEYHKLKIFYMERAGTNSNCLIKFNLPVVPTGNVIVEKTVEIANNLPFVEEMSFTFKAEVDGIVYANQSYIVSTKDASGNVTSQTTNTTDAQGQFTLKHNQTAYFNRIDENTKVKITEITPGNFGNFVYESTTVNGSAGLSAEKTTTANEISSFRFVNNYETGFADLVINKEGISRLDHHKGNNSEKEETQSTIYTVTGTTLSGETVGPIRVVIVGNSSVTIKDLPIGSYTVTEETAWSWRYDVDTISTEKDTEITVSGAVINFDLTYQGETVTYKNKRDMIYWLSGDSYCENWWGNSGNVIRKDDED